jgi:hypothetical protein
MGARRAGALTLAVLAATALGACGGAGTSGTSKGSGSTAAPKAAASNTSPDTPEEPMPAGDGCEFVPSQVVEGQFPALRFKRRVGPTSVIKACETLRPGLRPKAGFGTWRCSRSEREARRSSV